MITLDRIGIKFNSSMIPILKNRIAEAEATGRGLNLLFSGSLKFCMGEILSKQGEEFSYTLYDDGETALFNWDCSKAYNGDHKFWLEGFKRK